eukprot:SAG31_NODE_6473_length_2004_cov_1.867192_2_plen_136_part_01
MPKCRACSNRDVPFSAIYWLGYEQIKASLVKVLPETAEPPSLQAVFLRSFVAGASSGAVAATLTTPFDLIKTRQQVLYTAATPLPGAVTGEVTISGSATVPGTFSVMRQIVAESGVQGLWTGLGPRLVKVAPACAI